VRARYCIKTKSDEPAGSQSDWMMEEYDDDIGDFSDGDDDYDGDGTDDDDEPASSPEAGAAASSAEPMDDSGNE
jgi:hypothetical protein